MLKLNSLILGFLSICAIAQPSLASTTIGHQSATTADNRLAQIIINLPGNRPRVVERRRVIVRPARVPAVAPIRRARMREIYRARQGYYGRDRYRSYDRYERYDRR